MTLQDLIDLALAANLDPKDVNLAYEGDVDDRWAVYSVTRARFELPATTLVLS